MGLFGKIKDILFDEETVEIPVITKEKNNKKSKKVFEEDEVIIEEIKSDNEEELFDMPKLKVEAEEEVRTSSFTFPVFDDDEDIIETTRSKSVREKSEKKDSEKKSYRESFDFLSSTSYRPKKETGRNEKYATGYQTEPKKPFSPSPIISPVYGILNENYKKEDIITRSESASMRLSSEKFDLDSVRKKAYGTLEDEIELSLSKSKVDEEILDEVPIKEELTLEDLSDEGISIDDLLIDSEEKVEVIDDEFNLDVYEEDVTEEIDLDYEKMENKEEREEANEEEDLFDLIDSLYAEKGEE